MNLEQQVCSLELAKRLKELGVKQKSIFYYLVNYDGTSTSILFKRELTHSLEYYISAFTVAELGEIMPPYIEKDNFCYEFLMCINDEEYITDDMDNFILENPRRYHIGYKPLSDEATVIEEFFWEEETEANARAKMLIYLLENKLISV